MYSTTPVYLRTRNDAINKRCSMKEGARPTRCICHNATETFKQPEDKQPVEVREVVEAHNNELQNRFGESDLEHMWGNKR